MTATCVFCSTPVPPIEQAVTDGWHPSFWINSRDEDGPVCRECGGLYLQQGEHSEMEPNILGRRVLIDRHVPILGRRSHEGS